LRLARIPEPARAAQQASALVCVCGLAGEAWIARRAGFAALVGAGDRQRTEGLVVTATAGAACLVSFGIAGALSPALRAGDLILSADILSEQGGWHGDEAWRRRLAGLAGMIGAAAAPVLGAGAILAKRGDKADAYARFGAVAVDLESDVVAAAAAAAGIPFAALRAIADPAERDLPPAALVPLTAEGRADLGRVAAALLRRPLQAASLLRLAVETRLALRALERAAAALHRLGARVEPLECRFDMA
jgi:adenosylhomocysteine nucleosidase